MKRSKLVRDNDGWETVSSVSNFANSHLDVVTEQVRTPSSPQDAINYFAQLDAGFEEVKGEKNHSFMSDKAHDSMKNSISGKAYLP